MWNVKCHKTALQSRNCPYKSIIKILKTRHFPQCYPSFFTKLLQVAASTKVGSFRVFHWWSPATWPEISNGMWQLHLFKNTLWYTSSLLLKMAIEIVDLPIKNGDFPRLCEFTRGYSHILTIFPICSLQNNHFPTVFRHQRPPSGLVHPGDRGFHAAPGFHPEDRTLRGWGHRGRCPGGRRDFEDFELLHSGAPPCVAWSVYTNSNG